MIRDINYWYEEGGLVWYPSKTRDTLSAYFHRYPGNVLFIDVWDVEMGPKYTPDFLSSTTVSNYGQVSKQMLDDCILNSGLGNFVKVACKGAVTIPEGIDHVEYIYQHALAQGYTNDTRFKGIYLNPHLRGGSWPTIAATAFCPQPGDRSMAENESDLAWNTMQALEKILQQEQLHIPLPGINCIWFRDQLRTYDKSSPQYRVFCPTHSDIVWGMHRQVVKCDVCGNYVTAQIKSNMQWLFGYPFGDAGGPGALYWSKCPYCKTVHEELPDIDMDTGVDIPQAIEHATHYCPNCHKFRRTISELVVGNEDKIVIMPWGVKFYLSQATIRDFHLQVGSLSTAMWTTYLSQVINDSFLKRLSYLVDVYLVAKTASLPGSGGPNPLYFSEKWISTFLKQLKITPIAQAVSQLAWVISAIFLSALLNSIMFNSGVVINLFWTVPVGIILPQKPGFDVPVCEECMTWTIPITAEELEGVDALYDSSETNPTVGMDFGLGGSFMPDHVLADNWGLPHRLPTATSPPHEDLEGQ